VVTNRVTRPFASRLPWFGVLHHQGRRSGRSYDTPLNAWSDGSTVIVALTYGEDVDWLANARAGSTMTLRGRDLALGPPSLVGADRGMARMPAVARPLLAAIGVDRFALFPILPGEAVNPPSA
jgi:deazaflavin-dependent oxidoreductase (nitroreductase family)